ncbi:cadmium resistance transporter [Tardiphaga sp.]|uniref:cadmium resistance transporter n=1 Tax=Tardiphaga sp. TaxID=1926292 RepID=UPI00352B7E48
MSFSAIALALPLFAVTNIDDIFVLLGFFSDPRFRARQIVVGQYLGMLTLIGVSLVAALVSLVLPPQYVGLLGLAPLAIGLKKLYDLRNASGDDDEDIPHKAGSSGIGNILSVAAVTIANGGDNIGVYAPLFATRGTSATGIIVITFLAMTAIWCLFAFWLVNHRTIGAPIRKFGHIVLPFVLIALGILILYEAGSFGLLI